MSLLISTSPTQGNQNLLERRDDLAILLDEHSVLESVGGLSNQISLSLNSQGYLR